MFALSTEVVEEREVIIVDPSNAIICSSKNFGSQSNVIRQMILTNITDDIVMIKVTPSSKTFLRVVPATMSILPRQRRSVNIIMWTTKENIQYYHSDNATVSIDYYQVTKEQDQKGLTAKNFWSQHHPQNTVKLNVKFIKGPDYGSQLPYIAEDSKYLSRTTYPTGKLSTCFIS